MNPLLTRVRAQVSFELRSLSEGFGAEDADEGLEAGVDLLVPPQAAQVFEGSVALDAGPRRLFLRH